MGPHSLASGVPAGCSQFFSCDELCTLQSCSCHSGGARRGTVYLKERLLGFWAFCRDLAQALLPPPHCVLPCLGTRCLALVITNLRCAWGPRSG